MSEVTDEVVSASTTAGRPLTDMADMALRSAI